MISKKYDYSIPRENCQLEMASYYNLRLELEEADKVEPLLGDYIELELNSNQDGRLKSLYTTLFNQFLIKYKQAYPTTPWVSIFNNQKNP